MPGGHLLLGFQAEGEPIHRTDAHGTNLPLTSYRHSVNQVIGSLEDAGFKVYATLLRAPELEDETTSQGFVIAFRPALAALIVAARTGELGRLCLGRHVSCLSLEQIRLHLLHHASRITSDQRRSTPSPSMFKRSSVVSQSTHPSVMLWP